MFTSLPRGLSFMGVFRLSLTERFHTSTSCNRWYKHGFLNKPVRSTSVKSKTFTNDWEHNSYQPRSPEAICSSIQELPGFQNLDERTKTLFSYQFTPKRVEFEEQLNAKLIELGYHPTDTSTGAEIVRMTMSLRFKKWTLQTEPRNKKLIFAIRALIGARQSKLRLLRATNLTEFNRLVELLEITGFRHPDPYELPDGDVLSQRKKAVREECYRSRLTRLAILKSEVAASERSYYEQKRAKLTNLLQKLACLDAATTDCDVKPDSEQMEKAKNLLKMLFQEVVQERRAEVLSVPESSEIAWYSREAVRREQFLAQEAEKAERQSRRKR